MFAGCSYLLGMTRESSVTGSLPPLTIFCLSPRMICPCQSKKPPAKELYLLIMILNYQEVQFRTHFQQGEIVERRYQWESGKVQGLNQMASVQNACLWPSVKIHSAAFCGYCCCSEHNGGCMCRPTGISCSKWLTLHMSCVIQVLLLKDTILK